MHCWIGVASFNAGELEVVTFDRLGLPSRACCVHVAGGGVWSKHYFSFLPDANYLKECQVGDPRNKERKSSAFSFSVWPSLVSNVVRWASWNLIIQYRPFGLFETKVATRGWMNMSQISSDKVEVNASLLKCCLDVIHASDLEVMTSLPCQSLSVNETQRGRERLRRRLITKARWPWKSINCWTKDVLMCVHDVDRFLWPGLSTTSSRSWYEPRETGFLSSGTASPSSCGLTTTWACVCYMAVTSSFMPWLREAGQSSNRKGKSVCSLRNADSAAAAAPRIDNLILGKTKCAGSDNVQIQVYSATETLSSFFFYPWLAVKSSLGPAAINELDKAYETQLKLDHVIGIDKQCTLLKPLWRPLKVIADSLDPILPLLIKKVAIRSF